MKYIGLLASSICVVVVLLVNSYYNALTLDLNKLKNYATEINFVLEEYIDNKPYVLKHDEEYINRLENIKSGIEHSNTTFLVKDYKQYKVNTVENLINCIKHDDKSDTYLLLINKYNELANKEIKDLLK